MQSIISAQHISKRYQLRHEQGYTALRDKLAHPFKAFSQRRQAEAFWALRDINFEVGKGEVLGIIGANGAGKSTLLKILSKITPPTEGEIRLSGKVSSLLEVGTGFHPELTGRENIYLNGAILGMSRKDITKKFDEIAAFSGVEQFLDTPVKRYSSGMQVRLAFAVASSLEPDILIIDEVLAVGDAAFQKKSLSRMEEATKKEGRTILFVSHNMEAVSRLCSRCILLEHGAITRIGPTQEVIAHYLSGYQNKGAAISFKPMTSKPIQIRSIRIVRPDGTLTNQLDGGQPFRIEVAYDVREDLKNSYIGISFIDATTNTALLETSDIDTNESTFSLRQTGSYVSQFDFTQHPFNQGIFSLNVYAGHFPESKSRMDRIDGALAISFADTTGFASRSMGGGGRSSALFIKIPCTITKA